jgi:1-acyl-sn-glycerol-3-phosphate acyltransferase
MVVVISLTMSAIIGAVIYLFVSTKTFGRMFEIVVGYTIYYAMTIPGIWKIKFDYQSSRYTDNYVIVANHTSFMDTMLLMCLPINKKYMMARLYGNIPILSWLCTSSGYIKVAREDRSTTDTAVARAISAVKDGSSIVMFPEGMRNHCQYPLLPLKSGAFRVANSANIKVLPVIISGGYEAYGRGRYVRPANITVTVAAPYSVYRAMQGSVHGSIDDAMDKYMSLVNRYHSSPCRKYKTKDNRR